MQTLLLTCLLLNRPWYRGYKLESHRPMRPVDKLCCTFCFVVTILFHRQHFRKWDILYKFWGVQIHLKKKIGR